jgi:hypothetical protein
MNQNIFCSKCHRIPSQCCCSSAEIQALHNLVKEQPQTDLIVLLREEVTLMQKYLEEQNLREHFVAWRDGK